MSAQCTSNIYTLTVNILALLYRGVLSREIPVDIELVSQEPVTTEETLNLFLTNTAFSKSGHYLLQTWNATGAFGTRQSFIYHGISRLRDYFVRFRYVLLFFLFVYYRSSARENTLNTTT
jgi:phosphatidate phosphatase APP1